MKRYSGENLGDAPHIAVLFYDAIGDFLVVTPLLRGLKEKYPNGVIDYYSGERTRELEEHCPYIESRFSVFGHGNSMRDLCDYVVRREQEAGKYDLAINCDFHPVLSMTAAMTGSTYVVGPCYDQGLRAEMPYLEGKVHRLPTEIWTTSDFLDNYGDVLDSNFIGEIFCRMAFVQTDFQRTEISWVEPPVAVPSVLISTGGKRTAKLWPAEHWLTLLHWCDQNGVSVGLLGDKPERQSVHYNVGSAEEILLSNSRLRDLRGTMSLPQVAGALHQASACVSIDNGIMHMAAAVGTRTLALFGASPWWLWAPRVSHLEVLVPRTSCDLCRGQNFRNSDCLRDSHVCMESIRPEDVIERLSSILES